MRREGPRTDVLSAALETKNTWHRPDPSFTYLLSFFLTLTSIAWGLAYADGFGRTLRLVLVFVFGHFIGLSLVIATLAYFLVGRLLGPGIKGLPGRRRQGLFAAETGRAGANVVQGEQLEFGYCFDVAIRAFFPVWVFLYVGQFLLMPVVSQEYWYVLHFPCLPSLCQGTTIRLVKDRDKSGAGSRVNVSLLMSNYIGYHSSSATFSI